MKKAEKEKMLTKLAVEIGIAAENHELWNRELWGNDDFTSNKYKTEYKIHINNAITICTILIDVFDVNYYEIRDYLSFEEFPEEMATASEEICYLHVLHYTRKTLNLIDD